MNQTAVMHELLDPAAWLEQALRVLTLLLRHEVAMTRALRGDERRENFLGLFLSGAEAETMLDEMTGRLTVEGAAPTALDLRNTWHGLARERVHDPASIWGRLADAFDIAEPELDLVLLAAAPALDPRFGRAYGYLNDDLARRYLTPALAARLLQHDLDALTLRRLLAPTAPLLRFGLIIAETVIPAIERPLRLDETVIDMLLGQPPALPGTVLQLGSRGRLERSVMIGGPDQASISLAVLDLAAARGLDLCLCPESTEAPVIAGQIRACLLAGQVPVIGGLDQLATEPRRALAPLLGTGMILLSPRPEAWLTAGLRAEIVIASPEPDARRRAWLARLTASLGPDQLLENLGHARHLDLLKLADACARADHAGTLKRMAEAQLVDGLNDLARRVESEHDLDDLVIPEASRKALVRLISWQTASADVLDVWGLGAVFNKRRSTVALFKGPSGTGKSMAAGIVGKALGLPVFRVDLAAMISKYIGETEKNLERLFRAAEGTDIVLFFDEADAIFGQRSEVSDSHDRYANLETSYLLQRLEAFDGISILATNLAQNMDAAFLRRIDIVIDFPAPSADHRRTLWGRIARTKAPLGADVDLDYLAERFELTGAEIRNCWLDAAHRAATGKPPITMPHLMQAIAGELTKQGKPLRKADFGNHYACLRGGRP